MKTYSLFKHHTMMTYWGSVCIAPSILNLGTRWSWMVSFTPRPFYPWETAPTIKWIEGCVGPKAGLDAVAKRETQITGRGKIKRKCNFFRVIK